MKPTGRAMGAGLLRGALGALALLLQLGTAWAQPAPVRIGVLTDTSGVNADLSGVGSEISARMAVEDFGGTVLGRPIVITVFGRSLPDEILGHLSFGDMAFLELTARTPTPEGSRIFNAMLVTLVEHGLTPSTLATRPGSWVRCAARCASTGRSAGVSA